MIISGLRGEYKPYEPKIDFNKGLQVIGNIIDFKSRKYEEAYNYIQGMRSKALNINLGNPEFQKKVDGYNEELDNLFRDEKLNAVDLSDPNISEKYVGWFDKIVQDKDLKFVYDYHNNLTRKNSELQQMAKNPAKTGFYETNYIVWQNSDGGLVDYMGAKDANQLKTKTPPAYIPYYDYSKDINTIVKNAQWDGQKYNILKEDGTNVSFSVKELSSGKLTNAFVALLPEQAKRQIKVDNMANHYQYFNSLDDNGRKQYNQKLFEQVNNEYTDNLGQLDKEINNVQSQIDVYTSNNQRDKANEKVQELAALKQSKRDFMLQSPDQRQILEYDKHESGSLYSQLQLNKFIKRAANALSYKIVEEHTGMNELWFSTEKLKLDYERLNIDQQRLQIEAMKAQNAGTKKATGADGEEDVVTQIGQFPILGGIESNETSAETYQNLVNEAADLNSKLQIFEGVKDIDEKQISSIIYPDLDPRGNPNRSFIDPEIDEKIRTKVKTAGWGSKSIEEITRNVNTWLDESGDEMEERIFFMKNRRDYIWDTKLKSIYGALQSLKEKVPQNDFPTAKPNEPSKLIFQVNAWLSKHPEYKETYTTFRDAQMKANSQTLRYGSGVLLTGERGGADFKYVDGLVIAEARSVAEDGKAFISADNFDMDSVVLEKSTGLVTMYAKRDKEGQVQPFEIKISQRGETKTYTQKEGYVQYYSNSKINNEELDTNSLLATKGRLEPKYKGYKMIMTQDKAGAPIKFTIEKGGVPLPNYIDKVFAGSAYALYNEFKKNIDSLNGQ